MRGMNSLASWNTLWSGAWSQWQLGLGATGWHPLAMAAAQASVALLSLAAARHAAHPTGWLRTAGVLLVLALITLLSLDLLFVEMARAWARSGGWYATRRDLQALVLLGLALIGLALLVRRERPAQTTLRAWADRTAAPQGRDGWLALGLGLVLAVAALRLVSWHASDVWLGQRVAGLSLGRLLEAGGLSLLGLRAAWIWQFDR